MSDQDWVYNFIQKDGALWVAYDETQAYELGRVSTEEEAIELVKLHSEYLERSGYYEELNNVRRNS